MDIRQAHHHLGEITGEITKDEAFCRYLALEVVQHGRQVLVDDLVHGFFVDRLLHHIRAHEAVEEDAGSRLGQHGAAVFLEPVGASALVPVGGVDGDFRVGAFQVAADDLGVGDVEVAVDQRRYFAEWAYPGQLLIT